MHPWTWPSEPWKRVHIDFAGPFLGKMYFLAIDAHSKWPEVFEMNQTTTARTITVLRHLFATYGLPDQIVSDNGPQFTAEDFAAFMQANGVRHIRCSPYHPSSNGAVERFVRTFKQTMTAGNRDGRTTQHRLENFLLSYRTVPHATTKVAPCTLFLGRSIRTRFDLLKPNLERQVCEKQAAQKLHHDKHVRQRDFVIGQQVMARNLRQGPAWVPGRITEQLGPVTFVVSVNNGQTWKRHIDHLKALGDKREITTESEGSGELEGEPEFIDSPSTETANDSSQPSTSPEESTRRYPSRIRHPPERLM
jgi:hypothetical protein